MQNKHTTCVIAESLDFISNECNKLYAMTDSLKLQGMLATDPRVRDRFNQFAEDLLHSVFSIKSLADSCIRDITNFEVQEDVLEENRLGGYSCGR